MTDFRRIKVIDIDIDGPLGDISLADTGGEAFGGIFCLVRAGAKPLRVVEFEFDGPSIPAAELLELIGPERGETGVRGQANNNQVSVVVATRDRAQSLIRCLDSLLTQTRDAREIIVVDNAPSSSQTADLVLSRYPGGRIRYVREDIPGLGRAHNTGLSVVTGDIILFTDDDVVVDSHWVDAMSSNFNDTGTVGCVTGLILPAELDTRAQVWTERHGGFGKGFGRKVFDLHENRPPGSLFPFTAGQFGSGANMAFSMQALRRIGGFDPALGAGTLARGGDDLAAFYAVVRAGFRVVYEPDGVVWHYHRRTEEGMRRQAFGYGMGLGAYLTQVVVREPFTALSLMRAFPAGLAHMVGSSSPKNRRLPSDYPKALVWQERLGVLAGVIGYMRSRAAICRHQSASRPFGVPNASREMA